jgi:hypothetical protein
MLGAVASALVATIVTGGAALAASDGKSNYNPRIRPKDFVSSIDNPYLPLQVGNRWVYEKVTEDGLERIVVEVTDEGKRVQGVDTTVVHDTVTLDGVIIEDTWDWYAQDKSGNVWYFGEDTHEYEDGVPVNSHGAWQAGVDGAKAGIVMKANPKVGDRYRQEYYAGEAEDMAKVLSLTDSVTVPFGFYDGVLKTKDFTPLEPGVAEHKLYAKGVGVVLELSVTEGGARTELIEFATG